MIVKKKFYQLWRTNWQMLAVEASAIDNVH